MATPFKSTTRRNAIRGSRPDSSAALWNQAKCNGTLPSLWIAAGFWILATLILLLREDVLPYRPLQAIQHDIISRVDFSYVDNGSLRARMQQEARDNCPRVYRSTTSSATGDVWQPLENQLMLLPDRAAVPSLSMLEPDLQKVLDSGSLALLQRYQTHSQRPVWQKAVAEFVGELRRQEWVILPAADRQADIDARQHVTLLPGNRTVQTLATFSVPPGDDLKSRVEVIASPLFRTELSPKIVALALAAVRPTHELDVKESVYAANNAADRLNPREYTIQYRKNEPIVKQGIISLQNWQVLREENRAYLASLHGSPLKWRVAGLAGVTLLLTIVLVMYTVHFQPKVVRNHARALAVAGLLLSMLLLAELAGMGTGPLHLLGVAPTLLVGMTLALAYDQRFALGIASVHAMLVTIGLDERVGFLVVIWIGLICACFLLTDVRSRSKLIEVGGIAAVAMMVATAAWGLIAMDPWWYIANNALYAGAAGLATGFVVLGILPFVEKSFRITTSMTLLELADASHPLLRRLAIEAPGTYSHSWQVATLAQASAEAIGANSLLCRVAAYYHDVGKINKADYFVENQQAGQQNRHINLTPSVSFLIIKGHVADGIELAREYSLPTSLFPFIQQHHGTTLVEYFYHQAKTQHEKCGDETPLSDTDFRYPGPKPKSREVAILMLADAVESATRAMTDPTAVRIEALVHKLTMGRLMDGQFDECDLTLRELNLIQKSLAKTLLSIYHGRIPYPTTTSKLSQAGTDAVSSPVVRTA
jgi:putative nucleotidyltransferase with HDIG domain